ncbi:hypothetical protein ACS0TY_033945 [Phlomoides rotata]
MFNSSGVVEQFEVEKTNETFQLPAATVAMKVRGCGRFGVYSSQRPLKCSIGNTETVFDYEAATGLVTLLHGLFGAPVSGLFSGLWSRVLGGIGR